MKTKLNALRASLIEADKDRRVLSPEKIVFILENGFSAEATLYSSNLRNLVVSGLGYAEWPSHQQAAVYATEENKTWKFV